MLNNKKDVLPVMVLKDSVPFPNSISPVILTRKKSFHALRIAEETKENKVILVAQKENASDDPSKSEIHKVGVIAKIVQVIQLSNDGNYKILTECLDKAKLSFTEKNDCIMASYEILEDEIDLSYMEAKEKSSELFELFSEYAKLKLINPQMIDEFAKIKSPYHLVTVIINNIVSKISLRQPILESQKLSEQISLTTKLLIQEITVMETEKLIKEKLEQHLKKTQKDYYLNEQIKVIQKELGNDDKSEIQELEDKIKTIKFTKEAKQKAESEIKKLKIMNPISAESGIIRNYLDILFALPWGKYSNSKVDVKLASEILDRDHFGLEKVKERILEYLAVLQRSKNLKSPILCLVGPPGVGKTSLVKSIADAVGRKYAKFSLGGIRDEAEIRGHRRTYVGSMPGKIISLIKKSGVSNPVILLDELDKINSDFRGDPASALLEVLDPEQNSKFNDHYIEVEYDLSDVMFIATANSLNLPRPLLDRMEIIHVSGYIEQEKMNIATKYLIPKQLKLHNVSSEEIVITDDALLDMIRYYTKESGVRNLEREIASLIRKSLKKILENKDLSEIKIGSDNLSEFLGVKKYSYGEIANNDEVGVINGLAYTEVGGDLLSIESVLVPGKGEIKATGKLGEVMKESAQIAHSFLKSKANLLGINLDFFKDYDIHLHFPEGAVPKDGPSAGIAIFTAIFSLLTSRPASKFVAMTGEITLTGKILAIGGLKEKLLGAVRGGVKTVIIPKENEKDMHDIPREIKDSLKIIALDSAVDIIPIAILQNDAIIYNNNNAISNGLANPIV